jgi:hypothetical protein
MLHVFFSLKPAWSSLVRSHRVWLVKTPRTLLLPAPPSTTRPQLLILTADAMILAAPVPQVFWGASFFLSTASLRIRPEEAVSASLTGIVMVAVPATLNVIGQVMVLAPVQLPEPPPAWGQTIERVQIIRGGETATTQQAPRLHGSTSISYAYQCACCLVCTRWYAPEMLATPAIVMPVGRVSMTCMASVAPVAVTVIW